MASGGSRRSPVRSWEARRAWCMISSTRAVTNGAAPSALPSVIRYRVSVELQEVGDPELPARRLRRRRRSRGDANGDSTSCRVPRTPPTISPPGLAASARRSPPQAEPCPSRMSAGVVSCRLCSHRPSSLIGCRASAAAISQQRSTPLAAPEKKSPFRTPPIGRAPTSAEARRIATSGSRQPSSGSHVSRRPGRTRGVGDAFSASSTQTVPSRARRVAVANSTSALVEVVTTAPGASSTRGMTTAAVLCPRGGATAMVESSSLARSSTRQPVDAAPRSAARTDAARSAGPRPAVRGSRCR